MTPNLIYQIKSHSDDSAWVDVDVGTYEAFGLPENSRVLTPTVMLNTPVIANRFCDCTVCDCGDVDDAQTAAWADGWNACRTAVMAGESQPDRYRK